ncbi:MAG TPA: class I SAM-dependent methyltransferase [Ktedonobacteraceae bacterium]|nr:class I SAM-dependent methyltransferase [Ktedonobacteraceae bacterium]
MQNEPKKEYPSTYYVQGKQSEQELERLTIQGQMMTEAMGGPLSEQAEPSSLRRVLDIACGPGEWVIATAKTYPTMSLTGIDISRNMIQYAREQAGAEHLEDRVSFHVMDALLLLEFPASFFDLVNLRCCVGFMRTWDWPKMIKEMRRVSRAGAVVRITDAEAGHTCPASPALTQFSEWFQNALFQAGNLFEPAPSGLTGHLASLLGQHGCKAVQARTYSMTYQAGTPSAKVYYDDMQRAFQTLRPFILKWGPRTAPDDYDALCQQALAEIQQSNFQATWNLLTAWGTS